MMKKLASLLMSLVDPPVYVEPGDPDDPVMPMSQVPEPGVADYPED